MRWINRRRRRSRAPVLARVQTANLPSIQCVPHDATHSGMGLEFASWRPNSTTSPVDVRVGLLEWLGFEGSSAADRGRYSVVRVLGPDAHRWVGLCVQG